MRERTGLLTETQLRAGAAQWHEAIERDGRHPRFTAWQRERPPPDDDATLDFSLGCLLDGIEARVGSAGA